MSKAKINKNIISKNTIKVAIDNFMSIAEISINEDSDYYNLEFINSKVLNIEKEFENYLIDYENSNE